MFTAIPDWVRKSFRTARALLGARRPRDRPPTASLLLGLELGRNDSAIAIATAPANQDASGGLTWRDEGIVIRSRPEDDFNAIDPAVFADHDGRQWLAFGSFWSGLKLVELDPVSGHRLAPDSPVHSLARHEAIEAPALHRHGRDYFL